MDILPATIVSDVTTTVSGAFTANAALFQLAALIGATIFMFKWAKRLLKLRG